LLFRYPWFQVIAIHIPERYRGSKRDFEHDLAIVEVKFVFTSVVVPLCVDWTGRNLPPLKSGEAGLVRETSTLPPQKNTS